MRTKLTLSVDQAVVERAKRYARKSKRSLSELVTSYLRQLTMADDPEEEIDPVVRDAADELPLTGLPDPKDAKLQHLMDKYLHA